MRYLPAAALLAAIASIGYLPPLLGGMVVGFIPLTLVLTLEAISPQNGGEREER